MPFKPAPRVPLKPFAAEGSKNAIPDAKAASGDGYAAYDTGFPPETQLPIASGGIPPRRGDFNGILNDLSQMQCYLAHGPVYWPFSNVVAANGGYPLGALIRPDLAGDGRILMAGAENTTSNPNADPAKIGVDWFRANGIPDYHPGLNHREGEFVVWTQDRNCYRCKRANGPGYGGVRAPSQGDYWQTLADYAQTGSGGSAGGDPVYPGAFAAFYEKTPPPGWMARNGALVTNASAVVPKLWTALQQSENTWKLKSEADWQALSQASPWNGIGGVPYFVLNIGANSIRLPDTRGMYQEDAGFDGLAVGGVHGDAIRNISGRIGEILHSEDASGALYEVYYIGQRNYPGGVHRSGAMGFDASRQVPTASRNRPAAFGVLGCVYVGPAS